jgi:hypothetical protein
MFCDQALTACDVLDATKKFRLATANFSDDLPLSVGFIVAARAMADVRCGAVIGNASNRGWPRTGAPPLVVSQFRPAVQ